MFGGARVEAAAVPSQVLLPEEDDDANFDKLVAEVEKSLNELLLIDENKQLRVRKEMRDGLPMPAEQLEKMIGGFLHVNDKGKIEARDPEMIRPYLPMIKNFLGNGGTERLKKMREELKNKSPEERREAVEKLMQEGRGFMPGAPRAPENDDKDKKKEKGRAEEKRAIEEKKALEKRVI